MMAKEQENEARDDQGQATERQQDGDLDALLPKNDEAALRQRWDRLQATFVDEPRQSVEEADAIVTDVITRLARSFAEERTRLERQWEGGGDVSTEDLRQALRHYRSFFERLMAA